MTQYFKVSAFFITLFLLFLPLKRAHAEINISYTDYKVIANDSLWNIAKAQVANEETANDIEYIALLKNLYIGVNEISPGETKNHPIYTDQIIRVFSKDSLNNILQMYKSGNFWKSYIQTGNITIVNFNRTKNLFDDTWYGGSHDKDPMGNLMGGEKYEVQLKEETKWVTTGFNEGSKDILTATYTNVSIDDNKMSLWGRGYKFDYYGRVFDHQYGWVGRLELPKQ